MLPSGVANTNAEEREQTPCPRGNEPAPGGIQRWRYSLISEGKRAAILELQKRGPGILRIARAIKRFVA